jgi:large subunit ribosomal protein L17
MRHHNANRKFGRKASQRNALMKSLARSLVKEEKIVTTEAKAKELRPYIEKMVTNAKKGTLASRRNIVATIGPKYGKKLVDDLAPTYEKREGGYTRIVKLPLRQKDAAKMAHIEFVK